MVRFSDHTVCNVRALSSLARQNAVVIWEAESEPRLVSLERGPRLVMFAPGWTGCGSEKVLVTEKKYKSPGRARLNAITDQQSSA